MACQFKLRILTLLFISCYLIYIVLFTKTDGDGQRRVYPTPKKKSPTKYKEFLKNSPLYGLSYYETYGSVRSDFMDNENEKGVYQDWLVYFPEFADSLNKFNQQKHNPNVSFDTFGNSKVVIVDRKAEYKTGDIFEIQIASYDWKENKSSFGGDYFVAKLIYEKNNLYPDGISGAVTDHRNGTYSIRIPLLIPGQARLEVRLMIPLKGVADLISCTSSPKYLGTKYVSRYETNETTECNIDFKFADIPKDKICDYSNPRNQEPWFCIKPPSGKCPKITYENFDASASEPESAFAVKNINCNNGELQNIGSNRNILGSPIYVTVSPENSKPIQKLPPCATGIGTKAAEFKPSGYIVDGVWKSTFCDNKIKQIADAKTCFENKEIYFLGDSTTRQHFYFFAQKFGLTAAEAINDDSLWHGPKVATGPGNIRIYYRAHGLPFQNKGPPGFKPYMSDVLDRILPGQDEVLIILNIGLHIMNYEPSLFVHRMLGIREAMLRLNQRRDKVRYIYRSHRMLNNTEFGGRNNGWLLYRYNVIAQQIFQGVENFFYFDVWDFSILWSYKQFHPPQEYLEQESLYLSSFICN